MYCLQKPIEKFPLHIYSIHPIGGKGKCISRNDVQVRHANGESVTLPLQNLTHGNLLEIQAFINPAILYIILPDSCNSVINRIFKKKPKTKTNKREHQFRTLVLRVIPLGDGDLLRLGVPGVV